MLLQLGDTSVTLRNMTQQINPIRYVVGFIVNMKKEINKMENTKKIST
jgi:hypothetical protein